MLFLGLDLTWQHFMWSRTIYRHFRVTAVNFYQTTRCHITEDNILSNHRRKKGQIARMASYF